MSSPAQKFTPESNDAPQAQTQTLVATAEPAPPAPVKASRRRPILIAAAAVVAVGIFGWWLSVRGIEDTDDAQIDGDVVSVPARTSGVVTAIHFADNHAVKAGDVLAEIDAAPQRARLAQAEADLASAAASAQAAAVEAHLAATNARGQKSAAHASLQFANASVGTTAQQIAEADAQVGAAITTFNKTKLDLSRAKELSKQEAMSQAQLDAAQAAFDTAQAQLAQSKARAAALRSSTEQAAARVSEASARLSQASTVEQQIADAEARAQVAAARVELAKAQRDLAALELSYTQIRAPQDGVVSKRAINVGQMVQAGSPIAQLVPTERLWVTGNFKETQLAHMKAGQPARVRVDTYRGIELDGTVESFSAATGARFSLLPPDNASGNYTKVVQRVPVRVTLKNVPAGVELRPGMSVELSVNTR
jgi:membrane fusion protein (multidrug efflux system)